MVWSRKATFEGMTFKLKLNDKNEYAMHRFRAMKKQKKVDVAGALWANGRVGEDEIDGENCLGHCVLSILSASEIHSF